MKGRDNSLIVNIRINSQSGMTTLESIGDNRPTESNILLNADHGFKMQKLKMQYN